MINRILVVDDNMEMQDVLVTCLIAQGLDVDVFGSADAAMDAFSNDELREFDFIVTDLEMPGIRGDEFALYLHSLNPQASIFIISGAIRNVAPEARDIASLIEKPFSVKQLIGKIMEPPPPLGNAV